MASSNNVITAPVVNEKTTGDIQVVIGAVGTSDLETLCKWGGLNKWARYKPIRLNKVETLTDAEIINAGFGLAIPTATSSIVTAKSGNYVYQQPRGGGYNEPYRQTDFNGYNHIASPPCVDCVPATVNTQTQSTAEFVLTFHPAGTYSIGLEEINPNVKECYLAIAIKYTLNGADRVVYKTTAIKIKDGAQSISFNINSEPPFSIINVLQAEYWWVAATLEKSGVNEPDPAGNEFYPLPFSDPSKCGNTLSIERGYDVSWTAVGLATSINSGYDNITPYETQGGTYYHAINGTIYFVWKITNATATTKYLNLLITNVRLNVSPSFAVNAGASSTTGDVGCNCYLMEGTTTWTRITSSSTPIAANSSIYIKIGASGILGYLNGSQSMVDSGASKQNVVAKIKNGGILVGETPALNISV